MVVIAKTKRINLGFRTILVGRLIIIAVRQQKLQESEKGMAM
jgi:hypothetical protein